MKKKCLQVGAGGFGWHMWINQVYPDFADRMEVVGLVDTNPEVLARAAERLGLPQDQCFDAMDEAFDRVEADFCAVVVPPWHHKEAVVRAAEKGMDVISEKPIADTPADVRDIRQAVEETGVKMAVIQNYRYTPRMLAFREALHGGGLGRINYVFARFAANYIPYGKWGAFRHEMQNPLLIEGSVHHFDMIRNLTGEDCETIAGSAWNPEGSSFKGDCIGLFTMTFTGGVRAMYEGNLVTAGDENVWYKEYYRAECEKGAVEVGADGVVWIKRTGEEPEEVPHAAAEPTGHHPILRSFLDWLEGGPEPETSLRDNVNSMAMIFAALDAANEGCVRQVSG